MKANIKFFAKVLLVLLLSFSLVLTANFLYIKGSTYKGANSGMDKFEQVPTGIQFANFGPSYGMSCFVYDELEAQGKSCFNFSLTMQDLYHDYSLYKAYEDNFESGAVVAISLSYFSFCSDTTTPSSARYYKLLDDGDIKGYSLENDFSANVLPIYGKGSALLRDLLNDTLNSVMEGAMDSDAEEAETEAASGDDKAASLKSDSDVRVMTIENGNLKVFEDYIQENKDLLVTWIEEMKAAGLRPILVLTPYWHDYANGFDAELLDKCYTQPALSVAELTGVPYLDFNSAEYADYGMTPEYFFNCDHVSKEGSVEFMRRYVQYLTENNYN